MTKKKAPVTANDFSPLARQIRLAFIEAKRSALGIGYKLGQRMDTPAIWRAAAEACRARNMNPADFVRIAFMVWPAQGQGPLANQLYCSTLLLRLDLYCKPRQLGTDEMSTSSDEDLDYLLKQQFNALLFAAYSIDVKNQRTINVLVDCTQPFTAWFRVLIAHHVPEIWENYGAEAVLYFQMYPATSAFLVKRNYPIAAIIEKARVVPPNPTPPRTESYGV